MRGFAATLIVVLVLAAAAFAVGWVQILLPPGTYAVIATKTGGFDSEVIRSGVFVWRWERLIPTNMTIYRFNLTPYRKELSFGGTLPSAELYSSVLPQTPEFSFSGQAAVQLELRPESLPGLVREGRLSPDTLQAFYEAAGREVSQALAEKLSQSGSALQTGADLDARLLEELRPGFPDLNLLSLSIYSVRFPDRELYDLARKSYRELVGARDEARNAAAARQGVDQVEEDAHRRRQEATLASLREYGKLLNEYPVLLKAMYVQRLTGKDLAALPGFDLESFLATGQ
jgi:hypothetical protein